MGCLKSHKAKVQARRDAKCRAVTAICELAEQFPLTAEKGNAMTGREQEIFPLFEVFNALLKDAAAATALSTGKGCNTKPADCGGEYRQITFADFMRAKDNVVCTGSYLEAAWAWAKQIIDSNPNSFPMDHDAHDVKRLVVRRFEQWKAQFE